MKRLFSLLLILALVPVVSLADLPDISELSFDELVELKQQINLALWSSDTWQEVKVPVGTYKIGEDIPAGKWTISAAGNDIFLVHCDKLDGSGKNGDQFNSRFYYYTPINAKDSKDESYPKYVDLNCYKGNYIIISYGPALFTPFTGKPDLGFQ